MKKSVLFITNIPAPYRIDFYNELGKEVDLTVLFEAKGASDQGIRFNYNMETISNFKAVFLSEGNICEKKINWEIVRFLRKNKFNEIVVTSYSYYTEMIGLIYLKLHRIPYFMETDGGMIRKESGIKRRYKRFLISGAKGYFSPSKSSDDYLAFYGAKRDKIYRYPFTSLKKGDILPQLLTADEKRNYKNQLGIHETFMILGVGQFIHRKGWDVLLRATEKLDREIGVYIVGGEPTEEYLKIQKDYGLTNVHFEGFKTKEELKKFFMAADVFVLPTREDIWGLVINEAMAYGLPIITTDACVAGIQLVEDGENGYIVPREQVDELASKLNMLITNRKLLGCMRKSALAKIAEYTVENMAGSHALRFIGDR